MRILTGTPGKSTVRTATPENSRLVIRIPHNNNLLPPSYLIRKSTTRLSKLSLNFTPSTLAAFIIQ